MKEPADYIEEYYNLVKDKYPHLTYEQVEAICRIPFKVLKEEMKKGSLKTVRLKYFGTFHVPKKRAIALYAKTLKMHKDNKMTDESLTYITDIVTNYLKENHNEALPLD